MKKILFIILLLIILISCNKQIDKNNLKGDYYLFSTDSVYSELFISDKEIAFYNDLTDIQFLKYSVNEDTLIFSSKIPGLNIKYLLSNIHNEGIILEKLVNNEKIYLNSIKDSGYSLEKAFNSDFNHFKYQIAYSNRRNIILEVSKTWNYDSLIKSESSDSIPKTVNLSY